MEAGQKAGGVRAGSIRRIPVLLRHDRVQRVHLRQPTNVPRGHLTSQSQGEEIGEG